ADVLAASAAEHLREDVLEAAPATGATGTCGEPRAAAHRADGVVLLALLRVGEDRIGLADVLETLLRRLVARVGVRVPLAGQLAVGLLQRLVVDVLLDAEDGVEVLVHPVLAHHAVLTSFCSSVVILSHRPSGYAVHARP